MGFLDNLSSKIDKGASSLKKELERMNDDKKKELDKLTKRECELYQKIGRTAFEADGPEKYGEDGQELEDVRNKICDLKKQIEEEENNKKSENSKDETASDSSAEFIFCSECGAKCSKDAKFCNECGNKLKE
ncbi:MAG TPA: zinc-ribbon domain-containing protein [Methanocorpusculum sp.]|nr:zinc-ribbon domain-containing protein [Methanocorpusculum sp.]